MALTSMDTSSLINNIAASLGQPGAVSRSAPVGAATVPGGITPPAGMGGGGTNISPAVAAAAVNPNPSSSQEESNDATTSILRGLGSAPTPPTAPMYTSTAAPAREPKFHEFKPQPMVSNMNPPMERSVAGVNHARRMNRFAGITNAINAVSNTVQEHKNEDLKTDIINVTRSQSQIAAAQKAAQSAVGILKDPTSSPEAKKAATQTLQTAQQVMATNKQSMEAILKDDKRRKNMAEAFDVSFTDPTKNNTTAVNVGKDAMQQARESEAAGLSANTPEEKAIQEFNKSIADGSYSQQFMNQQPQQIGVNPQYEQQVKDYEKQRDARQKLIGEFILPQLLRNQLGIEKQRIASNAELQRAQMVEQNKYDLAIKAFEANSKVQDARNKAMLQAHDKDNGMRLKIARLNADLSIGLYENERLKGLPQADRDAILSKRLRDNFTMTDAAINNSQAQLDKAENAIYSMTHRKNARGEMEEIPEKELSAEEVEDIAKNKSFIQREKYYQQNMRDVRDDLMKKTNGSPTFGSLQHVDPNSIGSANLTPGASNFYGQLYDGANGIGATGSSIVPNDDSAGSESDVIRSGNYDSGGLTFNFN